ncbi:hypothetical protein ACROYT_G004862 [Oculina patagonica]
MSDKQAKGIEQQEKLAKVAEVQAVREEKSKSENKKCYRCGGNYPHKGLPCPALNEICKHCRKKGHFTKVCQSRLNSKKVNTVEEKDSDESTDEEHTYRITLHSMRDKIQPFTAVTIGGKKVKCLIDSGAGVNVIDTCSFNQLENIDITPTSKRIYGYRSSKPLPVVGNVKPLAQKYRRLPFHIRDQVEAELKNLEELDIIERAEGPTPWVSPIVVAPKKTGIRICVDMRAANQAIERERHPVPTVEDLIVDLNGATVFSKINLNQGYHQLELDEDSQEVLQGIDGVRNISDDIHVIVFGKNQSDHDDALQAVLQRTREHNLTADPAKCLFNQSSIDFFGHHFSADGISADDKKVASLINASPPKNATEARSFLGLAQYLARFIKDFASISAPIRQLTHQNAKWVWGPKQQRAFDRLKASMAASEIMKYFNPSLKTELIVDASPVGLGAILTQVTADGGTNIVAYAHFQYIVLLLYCMV